MTVSLVDLPPGVLHEIEAQALAEASSGAKRIAIKKLVELTRADERSINNNLSTAIGDHLIEKHPHLGRLIKRRRRGALGARQPQSQRPPSALLAAAAALEGKGSTRVIGVVFSTTDGGSLFISEPTAVSLAELTDEIDDLVPRGDA